MVQQLFLILEKNHRIISGLFFILFFLTGLAVYKDFGISVDEMGERGRGIVSFNYIFHHDKYLFKFIDRDYGVAFYVPMIIMEKALRLKDPREIFLMRHLMTFLVFYAGVIIFYFLCKRIFKSWKYGLAGSLFLVLSPRIFADSFYNCKDPVFMSGFIASMYTLVLFLEKKTFRFAVLHGVVSALVFNIRILGILIPCFTCVVLLLDYFSQKNPASNLKKYAVVFLSYIAVFIFFAIVFWPLLWENPIAHFMQTYKLILSRFTWETTVFYCGKYLQSNMLPWHYVPVWLIISTPPAYLLLFAIGCVALAKTGIASLKNRCREEEIHNIMIALWFFVPLVSVIVLRSVVYDGFRHLFFIYPAFLLIALSGIAYLAQWPWHTITWSNKIFRASVYCLIILNVFSTLYFMVAHHPYQNVYFNMFAGLNRENIRNNFDLDYWGLSYRQGLEYIAKTDLREYIKVFFLPWVGMYNLYILPVAERKRLVQTEDRADADYFIGNFRWPDWQKDYPSEDKEVYSIKVDGIKILAVYKLK